MADECLTAWRRLTVRLLLNLPTRKMFRTFGHPLDAVLVATARCRCILIVSSCALSKADRPAWPPYLSTRIVKSTSRTQYMLIIFSKGLSFRSLTSSHASVKVYVAMMLNVVRAGNPYHIWISHRSPANARQNRELSLDMKEDQ